MKDYDVQTVEIHAPYAAAFGYLADPATLPEWTSAFKSVIGRRAVMEGAAGSVEVDLQVEASRELGTVDWTMTFPDGSSGRAFSRLVENGAERCVYTFVLLAPPVPLERLEGVLAEQSRILADELRTLAARLSSSLAR